MTCRWFYANEKLARSVWLLAVLPGDVRSRLLHAYMEFHPLSEADFPPKLRKHFRWVLKQLTKRGPMLNHKGEVYRGSVEHTLSHIRNSTGAKIAERLVMLHDGFRKQSLSKLNRAIEVSVDINRRPLSADSCSDGE